MGKNNIPAMNFRQNIQELMTYSMPDKIFNPSDIDLVNVNIKLDKIGFGFNGYRIINLTDIHLGQWINPDYLDSLIDYVNSLNADLITLTGDYVSYILEDYVDDLTESFSKLKAKDGKVAVLGNHDHWLGESEIKEVLKKSDIIDLSNDVHTIEKDHETLNIAGIDSFTVDADNLPLVLNRLPDAGTNILLVHEPDFAEISSTTDKFDLQISGHSHGGQFIIPKLETTPFRGQNSTKYPVGMYKVGNMLQYTSKGLGTNSFRMRINCNPEITMFHLKTKQKKTIKID